jgi:hypothetical protein
MIRAAFLIEHSGEQLSCMLNPSQLVFRRTAGLGRRRTLAGAFTGSGRTADEPLLFTGGGMTELELELVFDVSLPGSTVRTEDVRDLTRPLWQLAENAELEEGLASPPTVRFVWGKAWNFPGVVASVAERFEMFGADGLPSRSWLRLKLLRVDERSTPAVPRPDPDVLPVLPEGAAADDQGGAMGDFPLPDDDAARAAAAEGGPFRRPDNDAFWLSGDPARWRDYVPADVVDVLSIPVAPRRGGGTGVA